MSEAELFTCPHCGAEQERGQATCWLCQAPAGDAPVAATDTPQAARDDHAASARRGQWTFQISTLLLAITLLAVWLAVLREAPGLGVLLALICLPGVVRTIWVSVRNQRRGAGLSTREQLWLFFGTAGVCLAALAACQIAFWTTCGVGFYGGAIGYSLFTDDHGYSSLGAGIVVGNVLGLIVGLVVLVQVLRWLWPVVRVRRKGAAPRER